MLRVPSRACAVALAATMAAAMWSQQAARPDSAAAAPSLNASIEQDTGWTAPSGRLDASVRLKVHEPTERVTVSLTMRDGEGDVVYESSQVLHGVKRGSHSVRFVTPLRELGVEEGRYPLEAVVVRGDGVEARARGRLLVVGAARLRKPLRFAVVVRLEQEPMRDPKGRFVVDPATQTSTCDLARTMAQLALVRPDLRVTLAPLPLMLEEWTDIADGYSLITTGGVVRVPATSSVPAAYRDALETLRESVAASAPVLRLPYGDPDQAALLSTQGVTFLRDQMVLSNLVLHSTIGAAAASGTALAQESLTPSSAAALAQAGVTHVVVAPKAVRSRGHQPAPGAYRAGDTTITAVVLDPRASRALSDPARSRDQLLDALFDRITGRRGSRPVTAIVQLGAGSRTPVTHLQSSLASLGHVGWVRMTALSSLSSSRPARAVSIAKTSAAPGRAPVGYWRSVADAGQAAAALRAAVGPSDRDVVRATRLLGVAGSRLWAGPDGKWEHADRGSAFAREATSVAGEVLGSFGIFVPDVTLSGTRGKVPINLKNNSGREMRLVFLCSSAEMRYPRSRTQRVRLRPGENIVSVPVDLGSEIAGRLEMRLMAGDLVVAGTASKVRASYIDRIALVVLVIAALAALLAYVRQRIVRGRTPAPDDVEDPPGETPGE